MKKIFFLITILLSISLLGADCDTVKPKEKDGGCKIEKQTEDLVTCLINSKNDKEVKLCHQKEKERKELLEITIKKDSDVNSKTPKKEEKSKINTSTSSATAKDKKFDIFK